MGSQEYTNTVQIGYARVGGTIPRPSAATGCACGADCREVVVEAASTRGDRVGAEYGVTLCDLRIFMDHAAEPVAAENPDACFRSGLMRAF